MFSKHLNDVTSCNDPVCTICKPTQLRLISNLRPIGTRFTETYRTYSTACYSIYDHAGAWKTNERQYTRTLEVIDYENGKEVQKEISLEVERI